jgi:tetratricopeptide (TPR) repeat protein
MKKIFALIAVFLLAVGFSATAQNLEEAVKKTLNERYESAEADLKELIAREPSNGDLYFAAGDNYFYWDQLDLAEAMYRKGMEVAPANPLNYAGLGRVAWMKNDAAVTKAQFAKAIEIMSAKGNKIEKNIKQLTYLKMAEVYIQGEKKNLEEAILFINTALPLNDKNPEAYIQLGDYYSERDGMNMTNAITQYNKALEVGPKYTRAILRKGVLYVKLKNYEGGLDYYNEAIALDPAFAPAYREKAELLYKAGRYPAAIESYGKYLELNNNCRVQQRYASFVYLTKDYKKAVEELEKALPCNTENAFMYRLLGYSYFETGNYEKSQQNLDKFFEMATAKGKPAILGSDYAYKGKLLSKGGNDSLALDVLKMAIEKDPEYTDGYSEVAAIYSKMKKHDMAAQYYQMKIEHTKEASPLDYYYLGQSRYFNKEYILADSAFAHATVKYPDAWFWRGRANNRMEVNPDQPAGLAKPFHETFIRLVGFDPVKVEANKKNLIEAYSYLGLYYGKAAEKNYDCSKAAWQKVLELDPTNKNATDAMQDEKVINAAGTCVLVTPDPAE